MVIIANIRFPAVAGRFYPADPADLKAQVGQMLGPQGDQPSFELKALIVPHAGYIYSGPEEASAFRLLRNNKRIKKVVLLGPAHYVPVHGLAVP